jgi:dTDP-4-dehydrorhamnose 3,5-epimerase
MIAKKIQILDSEIEGLNKISFNQLTDSRGSFTRVFCEDELQILEKFNISQVNFVSNSLIGTVRGLHFQKYPGQEGKIIQCLKGEVFDVCLDLRKKSRTFGYKLEINLKPGNGLFVPPGIAHGYQTLCDDVLMLYFHNVKYSPKLDCGIHWDNKINATVWPISISNISEKDTNLSKEIFYEMS